MPVDPILQSLLDSADALHRDSALPVAAPPAGVVTRDVGGFTLPRNEGTEISSSKLFAIVVIDCSDVSLCYGLIGAGGSLCVKRNCTVKSHSVSKSMLSGSERTMVFIQRSGPGTVT